MIRADFSFCLLIALLFLLRDSHTALSIIIVCGAHEWGHLSFMALLRAKIREIRLSGFGIRIVTAKNGAEPLLKSLAILLAGSAVNFLLFALLREKSPDTAMLSLAAGVYNLLPYSQLDGGAVLELFILGSRYERELRIALRLLRMALFALSAVLVYIYGYEYAPLSAALLLLCLVK